MIRKILTTLSLSILYLLTVGCHRQKLKEIVYTKALIPVLINWETRALLYADNDPDQDLYSASVWLFPRQSSEYQGAPLEYRLDNAVYSYIDVPIGVYDVLVFNKTIGEFSSNVGFRGTDKFDTFEYYTKPYVDSKSSKVYDGDQELRLEPDLLAAWRSEHDKPLVVTADMIRQMSDIVLCRDHLATRFMSGKGTSMAAAALNIKPSDFDDLSQEMRQLIDLKAERLTHITPIREYVRNLHSAKKAVGTLCGVSSSVKLAAAEYSTTQTAYNFTFDSKTITSDDEKDGYMDCEFRVTGPLAEKEHASYQIKNLFILHEEHDGSYIFPTEDDGPLSFEVADLVNEGVAKMGLDKVIPITISYDFGIVLPDVEFGSDGFDANVNGWDDEVIVPLILK